MAFPDHAAHRYLQTQIRSSTPLELVVMLYDGAIRHANAAADAMRRKDIPTRRDAISRALAIISELQSTLDMNQGGPVAEELDRLYTWMSSRFVDATVKQDAAPILEAKRILEILRDGWQQVSAARPAAAPGSAA
jgi:flagellar protein FliS